MGINQSASEYCSTTTRRGRRTSCARCPKACACTLARSLTGGARLRRRRSRLRSFPLGCAHSLLRVASCAHSHLRPGWPDHAGTTTCTASGLLPKSTWLTPAETRNHYCGTQKHTRAQKHTRTQKHTRAHKHTQKQHTRRNKHAHTVTRTRIHTETPTHRHTLRATRARARRRTHTRADARARTRT